MRSKGSVSKCTSNSYGSGTERSKHVLMDGPNRVCNPKTCSNSNPTLTLTLALIRTLALMIILNSCLNPNPKPYSYRIGILNLAVSLNCNCDRSRNVLFVQVTTPMKEWIAKVGHLSGAEVCQPGAKIQRVKRSQLREGGLTYSLIHGLTYFLVKGSGKIIG